MCTVIISVPEDPQHATQLIAVRDEDPVRPWNPLGRWWPEDRPGVVGVQDARAGGAWLAARPDSGSLAVLLNVGGPMPQPGLASRGEVVLDAVARIPADPDRRTQPYALVTVEGARVQLTLSDGSKQQVTDIPPGVHMLVNSPVLDDTSVARVARWLPAFRDAAPSPDAEDWFKPWLDLLDRTAEAPPTDDEAIIRDNRPYGIGTLSLLMCTASIRADSMDLDYLEFAEPGAWNSRFRIS